MPNTTKVVQLHDPTTDEPISPVVNVGSLYDNNGKPVDGLVAHVVAGTKVPVPRAKQIIPPGMVMYSQTRPSEDWLECNGQCFSQSKYPELAKLYPRDDVSVLSTPKSIFGSNTVFGVFTAGLNSDGEVVIPCEQLSNNTCVASTNTGYYKDGDVLSKSDVGGKFNYGSTTTLDSFARQKSATSYTSFYTGSVLFGSRQEYIHTRAFYDNNWYVRVNPQFINEGGSGYRSSSGAIFKSKNPWVDMRILMDLESYSNHTTQIKNLIGTAYGAYMVGTDIIGDNKYVIVQNCDRLSKSTNYAYTKVTNPYLISSGSRLFMVGSASYTSADDAPSGRHLYYVDTEKLNEFVEIDPSFDNLGWVDNGTEYNGASFLPITTSGNTKICKMDHDTKEVEYYTLVDDLASSSKYIRGIYYIDDDMVVAKIFDGTNSCIGKFDIDHTNKTVSNYMQVSTPANPLTSSIGIACTTSNDYPVGQSEFVGGMIICKIPYGGNIIAKSYCGKFNCHMVPSIPPQNGLKAYILGR